MKPSRVILLTTVALLVMAGPARAETRRVAVVVGNNVGAGARPALQFAEEDAAKMAQVLADLGGIAPGDLFLLQGQSLATVQETLKTVEARVKAWRAASQTVVLFYFSGHSDGQSLELGHDRLPFGELRRWLQGTGADVRLAFVDSCRSGGLLALKGGAPGPPFDISVVDTVESTGEVLITSSAADESALESVELRGSFFSHHLLSGLRGAADLSGDGLVTLSEAYQYAFARTVSTTTNTVIGPQHPNYDYRLSGRGEVVLTRIHKPAAIIDLPSGFDRILVADARDDRVIAEVGPHARRRLGVAPGLYAIRAWRQRSLLGTEVRVAAGQAVSVEASSLAPWPGDRHQVKGDAELSAAAEPGLARRWSLGLMLGATRAVGSDLGLGPGFIPGLRVGLLRDWRSWTAGLAFEMATFENDRMRETQIQASAGVGRAFRRGRVAAILAAEAGGGMAWQRSQAGQARESGLLSLAAVAEASVRVSEHWLATALVRAPATLMRLERTSSIQFMPGVWTGALYLW